MNHRQITLAEHIAFKDYERLKILRTKAKKTQEEIARILQITKQQYSLYETGKRTMPIYLYADIAVYYNVSLDYLAGLIDEPRELL